MKNLLFACFSFFLVNVSGVHADPGKTTRTLRVGAVLSLTGAAAIHGNNILSGIKLAKKDLEQEGWNVELLVDDDGTAPARSVSVVQNFAARGVKLFIGPTWSFLIAGAAPALQRQNLLTYAPAASWEVGGGPNPAVLFGTRLSSDKEPIFREWFKTHRVKTLALVVANSDWADVHLAIVKKAIEGLGITVVLSESYNYGDEEGALPAIARKVARSNPDTVFSTGSKEGLARVVKLFEDYKFKTRLLALEDLRDAVDNGLVPKKVSHVEMFSLSQPISEAFKERYRKDYHQDPGIYSDSAYDGLKIFAKAVEAVGDSSEAIRNYLRAESFSYEGYAGVHRFSKDGNTGAGSYLIKALNR